SNSDIDTNLWIDIFPVDGLPENIRIVKNIYEKCSFFRTIFSLNAAKLGEGTTTFRKYSKFLLKPIAKLYGKKRCTDQIERIAKQYNYNESQYVGAVTWGLYGVGERMLKADFEKSVEVEFEGHKFPTFSCWESYLHGLYGDYMQLPPLEKRKTHDMEVYISE
ncbi:MAG: LicD family protein, partial [Odoribacter sp.]|nr:LicD family protein [Odoribacter sp.]